MDECDTLMHIRDRRSLFGGTRIVHLSSESYRVIL